MPDIALTPTERLEVRISTPDLLAVEATWTSTTLPPAHYHPAQDERFEVREGALRVRLGDEERVVRAGEAFDVPRGTVHAMAAAEGHAQALWEVRPALGTERLFRALAAADGNRLRQLAVIARHRDEIRPTGAVGLAARLVSAIWLRR